MSSLRTNRDETFCEVQDFPSSSADPCSSQRSLTLPARIRRMIKLRESRTKLFDESLFADPAWDMLLELYLARLEGRIEYVSSICIASGVPSTTAIRWIKTLEQQGWISRRPDFSDGRRCFLLLTPKGEVAMERFFEQPEFDDGI